LNSLGDDLPPNEWNDDELTEGPFCDDPSDNEDSDDDGDSDSIGNDPEPNAIPESNSMPLPPLATYRSKDELFRAIEAWAKQYRYCFWTGRSNWLSATRQKVFYECDCAGS
jgi:hypothetical protein